MSDRSSRGSASRFVYYLNIIIQTLMPAPPRTPAALPAACTSCTPSRPALAGCRAARPATCTSRMPPTPHRGHQQALPALPHASPSRRASRPAYQRRVVRCSARRPVLPARDTLPHPPSFLSNFINELKKGATGDKLLSN